MKIFLSALFVLLSLPALAQQAPQPTTPRPTQIMQASENSPEHEPYYVYRGVKYTFHCLGGKLALTEEGQPYCRPTSSGK